MASTSDKARASRSQPPKAMQARTTAPRSSATRAYRPGDVATRRDESPCARNVQTPLAVFQISLSPAPPLSSATLVLSLSRQHFRFNPFPLGLGLDTLSGRAPRSEERRVGKECSTYGWRQLSMY